MNPIHIDFTWVCQLIAFLLVVLVLGKFAWRPLMNMMEKRRQFIEDSLDQAQREREEAERLKNEYQEEMRKARQTVQSMIEKATLDSEQRSAEIMAQAREEAEKTRQLALVQIEAEKQRAIADIQSQIADLSVAVAEKIIRQNLDAAGQKELIEHFIQEVGDRPC